VLVHAFYGVYGSASIIWIQAVYCVERALC
jgi:hypothetical protein